MGEGFHFCHFFGVEFHTESIFKFGNEHQMMQQVSCVQVLSRSLTSNTSFMIESILFSIFLYESIVVFYLKFLI